MTLNCKTELHAEILSGKQMQIPPLFKEHQCDHWRKTHIPAFNDKKKSMCVLYKPSFLQIISCFLIDFLLNGTHF